MTEFDRQIEEAFEKYAIKKYGKHTIETEGMSGILSGGGYQDRKEDYIAGAKQGRLNALEETKVKVKKAFRNGLKLKKMADEITFHQWFIERNGERPIMHKKGRWLKKYVKDKEEWMNFYGEATPDHVEMWEIDYKNQLESWNAYIDRELEKLRKS